jgi:hypothetical protein
MSLHYETFLFIYMAVTGSFLAPDKDFPIMYHRPFFSHEYETGKLFSVLGTSVRNNIVLHPNRQ